MVKIYTKTGDQGQTDLFGGERVAKCDLRVMAYGAIDAANAALGFVAASEQVSTDHQQELYVIMSDLFDAGAELSTSQKKSAQALLEKKLDTGITEQRIAHFEILIDDMQNKLPPLKHFVLPTGSEISCRFHLARVAVREAESRIVLLIESGFFIRPDLLMYVNRLSDLLFVFSRFYNLRQGIDDVLWQGKKALAKN